jgi:hypothetical protein
VDFLVFGPFEVVERGMSLELGGDRQQVLPAVLVVRSMAPGGSDGWLPLRRHRRGD